MRNCRYDYRRLWFAVPHWEYDYQLGCITEIGGSKEFLWNIADKLPEGRRYDGSDEAEASLAEAENNRTGS